MECRYNQDEFAPMTSALCARTTAPVPDYEGVCKYEDREEEIYVLTPKGCLEAALIESSIIISHDTFNALWDDFYYLMKKFGYIQEEE